MNKSSCAAVVSGKICKKPFWSRVPSRKECHKHISKLGKTKATKPFLEKNYGAVKSVVVSTVKEKKGKKK